MQTIAEHLRFQHLIHMASHLAQNRLQCDSQLLIAMAWTTQFATQRAWKRAICDVDLGSSLASHPSAECLKDLPIVGGDYREVFLAHLRCKCIRIASDLIHETKRI